MCEIILAGRWFYAYRARSTHILYDNCFDDHVALCGEYYYL